ncbi:MAG TPA: L-threonylcarbamoyladenylate synthase [Solirubrobacter sp.]
MMTDDQARALGACVAAGGVAVFPADTVYGLACDPENVDAVAKLYALKGRPPEKPAAVMFFDLLELGDFGGLLPGGVTLLLPNPERRFPLACTTDPETLGVRVPFLAPVGRPVLQSSANLAGGPDARRVEEVPERIRAGADLVIDGGELPGVASTVIDVRTPEWRIVRAGAVSVQQVEDAQRAVLHPDE